MDDNERNHVKTFDCHGDQNTLGLRWKRWLTAFELFADGKSLILNEDNANNRHRRRSLMLHVAGPDVQARERKKISGGKGNEISSVCLAWIKRNENGNLRSGVFFFFASLSVVKTARNRTYS